MTRREWTRFGLGSLAANLLSQRYLGAHGSVHYDAVVVLRQANRLRRRTVDYRDRFELQVRPLAQ